MGKQNGKNNNAVNVFQYKRNLWKIIFSHGVEGFVVADSKEKIISFYNEKLGPGKISKITPVLFGVIDWIDWGEEMDKREKIAILLDENALIIESINDITSILKEVANIKENCIQIEIRLNGTLEKLSNLANINRDKILALHTEIDKLQREIEETDREVFGPKFLSGFGKKEKPEIDLFKVVEDEKNNDKNAGWKQENCW